MKCFRNKQNIQQLNREIGHARESIFSRNCTLFPPQYFVVGAQLIQALPVMSRRVFTLNHAKDLSKA